MYHWQFGLGLLPVAAGGLALVAFGGMPGSSGGCLLWPAKLAGAALAGGQRLCLCCCFINILELSGLKEQMRHAWHAHIQHPRKLRKGLLVDMRIRHARPCLSPF
jgi:hypothetical protein